MLLLQIKNAEWPFDEDASRCRSMPKMAAGSETIAHLVAKKSIDFVINLPIVRFFLKNISTHF
jgi:hypothetical protein